MWQLWTFYHSGHSEKMFVAHVEVLALGLGLLNLRGSKKFCTVRSAGVGAAYFLGFWLYPELPKNSVLTYCIFMLGLGLNTWALFYLGERFTVGGMSWRSLCDKGPYRWIRHPQTLAWFLMIFAGLLSFTGRVPDPCGGCSPPIWLPVLRLLCAGFLAACVLRWEELTLLSLAEYSEYAKRVPWRLVPKVI